MPLRSLVVLAVLSFAQAAHATILQHFDTNALVRRADLIVIGVVGEQRVFKEAGRVRTESEIHVERILYGRAGNVIRVYQLGGQLGDIMVDVPGTAHLVPRTRMLLVLRSHKDRFFIAGMTQGAFRVSGDRLLQDLDVALTDGSQIIPAPGARVRRLADIEAAIAQVKR